MTVADRESRRRGAAAAGHQGQEALARAHLRDPDGSVRATALAALDRMGRLAAADLEAGLADPDPVVRRRAALVSARRPEMPVSGRLVELLSGDPTVAEMAAWALGERASGEGGPGEGGPGEGGPGHVVAALAAVAHDHPDPLCREAAVAALGAIGDPGGLPAILAATRDRPAVRRRAVLALAPFEGPDVDAALERALQDRDWQVRQAAEDLAVDPPGPLHPGSSPRRGPSPAGGRPT